jgi:hypothetical protein
MGTSHNAVQNVGGCQREEEPRRTRISQMARMAVAVNQGAGTDVAGDVDSLRAIRSPVDLVAQRAT